MFTKILIANRGEIAVRIIRACREMGISPVAIFSQADERALHVRLADEAYCVGPPPAMESYLRMETIIDVARQAGAQAIHPGYGFLAENPEFARAVEDAGLVFIGPGWEAMALLGNKTRARHIARRVGAPIVPGSIEPIKDRHELHRQAQAVGYPLLLKAAAGGGGKGMRLVSSPDELDAAFRMAQSEARAAFGQEAVYIEKVIQRPRHIEIQILGDHHGNIVHLGERECSIQRRHQKVIEECPSPLNDPDLRQRMGDVACRIAREAGYQNAGTVEFLVDEQKNFYFLEINTRLQVEHPVTEWVTGVDLVREQIRIAAGHPLSFRQDEIQWRGVAIECRIYAEDPEREFMPSPGRIARYRPPMGPGVRVDSGVYAGWEVPLDYDPLLSKLIVWGRTRTEAIERLGRALDEYVLDGIRTTIPFYRQIVRDREFIAGHLDTGYVDRFFHRRSWEEPEGLLRDAALIAAALHTRQSAVANQTADHRRPSESPWKTQGRWALLNSRL
ncbi:MAG: acetyl-CoA carboxylase biotin carboxylase subunit [Acidobacteria bacterium]|nr:MAG: acetyl-CoA carboxylase biotin carboxylase subunit [Acidobacteriota bacterium]